MKCKQFRKKPVIIEAFIMGVDPRPDWFTDKVTKGEIETHYVNSYATADPFEFKPTYCEIKTLEGVMTGDYKDYIIKGVEGEIYPCKPNIFKLTYEII